MVRALTSLNISSNNLGEIVKGPLPEGWRSKFDNNAGPWIRIADGHEQEEYPGEEKPEGAVAIANAISTLGTFVSLNVSSNALGTAAGGERIRDILNGNSMLQHLDVSDNYVGVDAHLSEPSKFAQGIADGLSANGALALTSLNIFKNHIPRKQANSLLAILKEHPILKSLCGNKGNEAELQMSGKMHGPEDVVLLAPEILANRTLSTVNILANSIGFEQANALIEILKRKDSLKTLCGFSGKETVLDLSDKGLSPGCGLLVANEVKVNRALRSLNVSRNKLVSLHLPEGWSGPDEDGEYANPAGENQISLPQAPQPALDGIIAVADAIKKSRMLTFLDLSENDIEAEGAKCIAEAIRMNVSHVRFCRF